MDAEVPFGRSCALVGADVRYSYSVLAGRGTSMATCAI
jgi:hypothetical protein